MTSAVTVEPLKPASHGLLCCSAAAGPLFVTVFVVEGARRPDYKPLRHPVSSLALGSRGWVQVTNFTVAGTLYLAGATGLLRARDPLLGTRLGPTLFAGVGLGLLGSAAFCTDPVSGYPPGTPEAPSDPTASGAMHNIAELPIFLGIPAAALVSAWRFHQAGRRGWRLYSAATGMSTLIGMALFGAGFSQASPRLTDCAGLLQRATIATGFGWLTAISAQALRRSPRPNDRSPESSRLNAGVDATGNAIQTSASHVFRMREDRVVEHWPVLDTYRILVAIGAIPGVASVFQQLLGVPESPNGLFQERLGTAFGTTTGRPISREESRAVSRRVYDGVISTGRAEVVDAVADTYIQNTGWTPGGRSTFANAWAIGRGAMPDGRALQTHVVAESDRVASISVWDGTITQNGRPVDFTSADFFRIRDGLAAEHWDTVDYVRLYQSFGLLPDGINDV